jgi:hypothetical protein
LTLIALVFKVYLTRTSDGRITVHDETEQDRPEGMPRAQSIRYAGGAQYTVAFASRLTADEIGLVVGQLYELHSVQGILVSHNGAVSVIDAGAAEGDRSTLVTLRRLLDPTVPHSAGMTIGLKPFGGGYVAKLRVYSDPDESARQAWADKLVAVEGVANASLDEDGSSILLDLAMDTDDITEEWVASFNQIGLEVSARYEGPSSFAAWLLG